MDGLIPQYETHFYCPDHKTYLAMKEDGVRSFVCLTDYSEIRGKDLQEHCFTVIPVKSSLRLLLGTHGDHCKFPVPEKNIANHFSMKDIKDGLMYRAVREKFGLRSTDLTVTLHLDGAWIHKTKWAQQKTCSLVQYMLNELPPSLRHRNIS